MGMEFGYLCILAFMSLSSLFGRQEMARARVIVVLL